MSRSEQQMKKKTEFVSQMRIGVHAIDLFCLRKMIGISFLIDRTKSTTKNN